MDAEQSLLVTKNVPLARFLARTVWERNRNGMDLEEVTSVAYQGLVSAALRWQPVGRVINPADLISGKAFGGFARQRIMGTILDWQRGEDHVQRSYRRTYKLLVSEGYGLGKTEQELTEATGLSAQKIRTVIRAVETTSISIDAEPDTTWESFPYPTLNIPAREDVESSALETTIKDAVARAVQELPPLHQVVIALRYHMGLELQTIAADLGLGLTIVREAHSSAVLVIHTAMRTCVEDRP